jgi:hypothetical protein
MQVKAMARFLILSLCLANLMVSDSTSSMQATSEDSTPSKVMRREPGFTQRAEAKPHKHHHHSAVHKSAKGAATKKGAHDKETLEISKTRPAHKKATKKAGKNAHKHSKAAAHQKKRDMSLMQRNEPDTGGAIPGIGGTNGAQGETTVNPPTTAVSELGEHHDITANVADFIKGFKLKFKVNFTRLDRNDQMLLKTNNDAVMIQLAGPSYGSKDKHIMAWIDVNSDIGPTQESTGKGVLGTDSEGRMLSTKPVELKKWYIVEFSKDVGTHQCDDATPPVCVKKEGKLCLSVCGDNVDNSKKECLDDEDKVCWSTDPAFIIKDSDFDLRDDEPTGPEALTGVQLDPAAVPADNDNALFGEMGDFEISYGPGQGCTGAQCELETPTETSPYWGSKAKWTGATGKFAVEKPAGFGDVAF